MVTFFERKNCWLLGIVLFLPAGVLIAQQKTYKLSELAEMAKHHLPALLQKQALVNSATASLTEAKHSFLPQVRITDQVNVGTDNSLAGSYLPMVPTPSSSAGVRAGNNYRPVTGNIGVLYGEYELLNFGLHKAILKNANAHIDLQQADLESELYSIQENTARAYFNLLRAQYRLGADKQNTDRYDSIFKVIQALAASGIKPGADSSLAMAELSRAKITYNQTLGNYFQLKEQLSYLTGIPAASLQIDSLANDLADKSPFTVFGRDTVDNPLLDYYVKRNNIILTDQAVIRKSYLPKVILAGGSWIRGSGIQYNDDYKSFASGLGYQRFNYMGGLAVTYNLFNGLYKKDRLAVNRFQLQASGYELEQQKLALNLDAAQADNALQTNEANLLELPVQLKAAADTYRQKLAQYKAGIISLIDLTNASFVLYRSQTDFIETKNDWFLAQLDKAAATGNLIKFIQIVK
ncbi:MAG: TolC family protein [Bacteroidota bacterium]